MLEAANTVNIFSTNISAYELLFELIKCGNAAIMEKAWGLLERLPTHPEWESKIESLSDDAPHFIKEHSIVNVHSILYLLEIISKHIAEESSVNWVQKFIANGWLNFLFDILHMKCFELGKLTNEIDISHARKSICYAARFVSLYMNCYNLNNDSKFSQMFQSKDTTASIFTSMFEIYHNCSIIPAPQIRDALKEGIYEHIITSLMTVESADAILNVICQISKMQTYLEYKYGDIELVIYVYMCIIHTSPQYISSKMSDEKLVREYIITIIKLMVLNRIEISRKAVCSLVYYLAFSHGNSAFASMLIDEIICTINRLETMSYSIFCGEYFDTMLFFLEQKIKDDKNIAFYEQLTNDTLNKLKIKNGESKFNIGYPDKLLVGYMDLLLRLLHHFPQLKQSIGIDKGLFNYLLYECLFIHPESKEIKTLKCLSTEAIHAAFNILLTLIENNQQCLTELINNCIIPMSKQIKESPIFDYSPEKEERSSVGIVGYKNLGCICYMISILQQFYMIEPFRYLIFESNDNIETTKGDYDDNLLHQLQLMFAHSQLSLRRDYNPAGFCFAFKDQNGKPTSYSFQQDAYEFVNCLFSRLETSLKNTQNKYLVQSIFGGKSTKRITCLSCNAVKNSNEDIYCLSLEVKHLKSLDESLSKYISGEIISGYQCESCNQKTNIEARHLLSQLPNILLIHLQRIVFNFDTYLNEKINSKFTFPKQLNIKQYSDIQTLQDDEYVYKLIGVVIHYGNAEAGHYYSIVKTKQFDKEIWADINDSNVKEFAERQFENECYGGIAEMDDMISTDENAKSAYMLVYEKLITSPIKSVRVNLNKEEEVTCIPYSLSNKSLPSYLESVVKADNLLFTLEKQLYSSNFTNFIKKSISVINLQWAQLNEEMQTTIIQLYLRLFIDAIVYTSYDEDMAMFVHSFVSLLHSNINLVKSEFSNIVQKNIHKYFKVLICCNRSSFREEVKTLLFYMISIPQSSKTEITPDVELLIRSMISSINYDLAGNWTKFNEFFELLRNCYGFPGIPEFMISQGLIAKLIDFYLEKESPLYKHGEKRYEMGNKVSPPNFTHLIDLVSLLICKCKNFPFSGSENENQNTIIMSENDLKCASDEKFYRKIFLTGCATGGFLYYLYYLCYNNLKASYKITFILMKHTNARPYNELPSFMPFLLQLIKIKDKYTQQRLEWIVGVPVCIERRDKSNQVGFIYGQNVVQCELDDAFEFISPMLYDIISPKEPLLTMLFKGRCSSKIETAKQIGQIYETFKYSDHFKEYIERLPYTVLTYSHAIDWMNDLLDDFYKATSDIKCEAIQHEKSWFDYAKAKINECDPLKPSPYKYIVGSSLSYKELMKEEKNGICLHVWAITVSILQSPLTKKQLNDLVFNKKPLQGIINNVFNAVGYVTKAFSSKKESKSEEMKKAPGDENTEQKEVNDKPMEEIAEVVLKYYHLLDVICKEKLYFKFIPHEHINFFAPESTLKATMNDNDTEKSIYTTIKWDPHQDWGTFDIEWGLITQAELDLEGSDFETKAKCLDTYLFNDNAAEQVNCPHCTMLNPARAEICSECMNPLK